MKVPEECPYCGGQTLTQSGTYVYEVPFPLQHAYQMTSVEVTDMTWRVCLKCHRVVTTKDEDQKICDVVVSRICDIQDRRTRLNT